jgi:hypothetical protein
MASQKIKAVAVIKGDTVHGTVYFEQDGDQPVVITGQIEGLKEGELFLQSYECEQVNMDFISMLLEITPMVV